MLYNKFEVIIKNINNDSPIRQYSRKSKKFNDIYKVEVDELKKIESELDIIYEKIKKPLKVVLMGEVKAGKSTLINSIIGEEVSYVDVVEATASIIEITHGFRDEAVIERYEQDDIIGTTAEINSILEKNKNNQDFFYDVKLIRIKKDIENLSKISIVDTPGLETITISNEQRTINYIQESDVVIWVMNSNHLGQSDVNEKIEEVYDLGKPIICIANRIDEINAQQEEVVAYIEDEIGYMIDKVIPMSARLAYRSVKENNKELLEKSGFKLLLDTLKEMNSNTDVIHRESILSSFSVQVDRDINVHKRFKSYIDEINRDLYERFINFENYRMELDNILRNEVNQWFENEFLVNEIDEIIESKSPELKFERFFSKEYIQQSVNRFLFDLKNDIDKKWSKFASDELINHIKTVELKYCEIAVCNLEDIDLTTPSYVDEAEQIVEEAKKGALLGGKIGAVIAGYTSLLGPAAAHVTLVGALGGVLPPLVIGGAFIKGALYLKNRNDKENSIENIREKLLNFKNSIKINYYNDIIDITKQMNNSILESIKKNIENLIFASFKEMEIYDIKEFICNIESYIEYTTKLSRKVSKVWTIDTNVFIDDPNILEKFNEEDIIILSKQVLVELDNKKRDSVLRRNVQKALDSINECEYIVFDDINNNALSLIYQEDTSPDNYILNTAVKYCNMNCELITSDKNLLAKCKSEGVKGISLQHFLNSYDN